MHISKSRLLFVNIFVSASIFFSCSIPQTETQTGVSPILLNRYIAEVELGMEQVSNNPFLAIEYFNRAIEHDLNLPHAFIFRGIAWFSLDMYANAIMDFDLALEADWQSGSMDFSLWLQDFAEMRAYLRWFRAKAGMEILQTIDKKEIETYILAWGEIYIDLDLAERHAGITGNRELIKEITKTRHLFHTVK